MEDVASEVSRIRKGLGLSQSEFAGVMGVAQGTVSRWESGVIKVDQRTLFAIRWMLEQDKFPKKSDAA